MNLAAWFARLLQCAAESGLIAGYQCNTSRLPDQPQPGPAGPGLNLLSEGVGSNVWQARHCELRARAYSINRVAPPRAARSMGTSRPRANESAVSLQVPVAHSGRCESADKRAADGLRARLRALRPV
jgi:hypothetical protein